MKSKCTHRRLQIILTVFVETAKVKISWENSCLKIWNPRGCWHLKPLSPSALQGEMQEQFSSLFQPKERRKKNKVSQLPIYFCGVNQLLPKISLRAAQASLFLHVQGLEFCSRAIHRHKPHCLILSSWWSTQSFVVSLPLKGFLCWPQRNDFASSGFISTLLLLIFFGSRISPALIL